MLYLPLFHSSIRFSNPIPVPQRVRSVDVQIVLLWFESEQGQPPFVGAFEDVVGRYREVGVNEFVIDHPPAEQYSVLEKVAADVIPRIRKESAGVMG